MFGFAVFSTSSFTELLRMATDEASFELFTVIFVTPDVFADKIIFLGILGVDDD